MAKRLLPLTLALGLLPACGLLPTTLDGSGAKGLSGYDLGGYVRHAQSTDRGLGAWLLGGAPLSGPSTMRLQSMLPAKVDLRPQCPPVYNQGPFRSCTGFTVAKGLGEFLLRKEGKFQPLSAAFHYGASRQIELSEIQKWDQSGFNRVFNRVIGSYHSQYYDGLATDQDTGASLAVAMGMLKLGGAVAESAAPYPSTGLWKAYWKSSLAPTFVIGSPLSADALELPRYFQPGKMTFLPGEMTYGSHAPVIKVNEIRALTSLDEIKEMLASGLPVACGVEIYAGFYSPQTAWSGVVPVPDPARERPLDGHAMLCVGYDDRKEQLIMRNSWGSEWGDKGYAYLPYAAIARGVIKEAWSVTP